VGAPTGLAGGARVLAAAAGPALLAAGCGVPAVLATAGAAGCGPVGGPEVVDEGAPAFWPPTGPVPGCADAAGTACGAGIFAATGGPALLPACPAADVAAAGVLGVEAVLKGIGPGLAVTDPACAGGAAAGSSSSAQSKSSSRSGDDVVFPAKSNSLSLLDLLVAIAACVYAAFVRLKKIIENTLGLVARSVGPAIQNTPRVTLCLCCWLGADLAALSRLGLLVYSPSHF